MRPTTDLGMLAAVLVLPCLTAAFGLKDLSDNVLRFVQEKESTVSKPTFCNDLDCPTFKVLKKTDKYELRAYEPSSWVSTNSINIDYDTATYHNFMKLFNYISGQNAKKEKIAMTVPVVNRIIPGQGPACETNFTLSFFMAPSVRQPPKPSDDAVFLEKVPAFKAYVISFSGFADKAKYIEHALTLGEALDADKISYEKDHYFTAGYDNPLKLFYRHNEIWFLAK